MSTPVLFVIVGKNEPLFEAEIDTTSAVGAPGQNDLSTRQNYFVLHSALDLVEKSAWTTTNMYLRVVDKVNHQQVSTFLTAANVKFMLLHGGKGEEVVKNFFNEVYGYYVKVWFTMNWLCILCCIAASYLYRSNTLSILHLIHSYQWIHFTNMIPQLHQRHLRRVYELQRGHIYHNYWQITNTNILLYWYDPGNSLGEICKYFTCGEY